MLNKKINKFFSLPIGEGRDGASVFYWLLSGCFLIFLMVIIGGITRLTHSGLSITEWNLLMGTFPPFTESQWIELFEKYKQSPEFREVHYFFMLEDFKKIFWWEYIHRLLGRFIGIVFIVPFFYFLVKKKISSELLPKLVVIFLLGAFQGFLGWYMVKSGLVNEPRVSHYRLAAHLITAFATFGFTFWVALSLKFGVRPAKRRGDFGESNELKFFSSKLKTMAKILFAIIVLQIIFGAFVAGLKAGYLYPTFPKMGNEWLASEINYALDDFGWIALLENGAAVQFIHRWLGILILFFTVGFWLYARKKEIPFQIQMAVRILLLIVILQFSLGLLTLLSSVPVELAVMHQAGAFFLFGAMLFLMHKFFNTTTGYLRSTTSMV